MAGSLASGVEAFTHYTGSTHMVLYLLAQHVPARYEKYGQYFVLRSQIAQQAHITLRQLNNILEKLVAGGHLEILTAEESQARLNPLIPIKEEYVLYYRLIVWPNQWQKRNAK